MSFITWDQKYELGIQTIDRQHKKLVDYINSLAELKESNQPDKKEEIRKILRFLVDYCDSHFKYEESCFRNYKYELEQEHIKLHRSLTQQVLDFKEQYESGKTELNDAVMSFLKNWLVGHILGEDQKYVECFHQHNLK